MVRVVSSSILLRILFCVGCLVLVPTGCGGFGGDSDSDSDSGGAEAGGGQAAPSVLGDGGVVDGSADTPTVDEASEASPAVDDEGLPALDDALPVAPDGYAVWVHDQEPPNLHVDELATPVGSWVRQGLLEGLFGVDASMAFYPELLAAEPTVIEQDGGGIAITYKLRSDLVWSDGEPLTAEDVLYTHQIWTEGCRLEADGSAVDGDNSGCAYHAETRLGYDRVTGFEVTSETGFTVTMSGFYPAWRELYSQVFAKHAFGVDAGEVNDNLLLFAGSDGPLPSSGPLVFERWDQGSELLLARNDTYHGSTSPDVAGQGSAASVAGVQLTFVSGPQAQLDALIDGDADFALTRATPNQEVATLDNLRLASAPGPAYEHWGFNLLNPHLAVPQVREAIAYALDKEALVAELYQPIFGDAVPTDGLGNTYWLANQAPYEDHQAVYAGANIEQAEALLASAGYERGSDGVYVHPDRGRLRLRSGTTAEDSLRVRQQALLGDQLAAAGIEIVIENADGGAFYAEGPFAPAAIEAANSAGTRGQSGLWDIAQFGWASGPWPGGQSGVYRSRSPVNAYGFASPAFDAKANECDAMVDDADRADCYNDLDRYVTTLEEGPGGLFMIPLSQRPMLYAVNIDRVKASPLVSDAPWAGPLVNVVDLSLSDGGEAAGEEGG